MMKQTTNPKPEQPAKPKQKAAPNSKAKISNGRVVNPIVKPEDRQPGYKVGRPSLYKPEYCDTVIACGKRGFSKVQMACELDVVMSTLDYWVESYSEFSDALTRARQFSQQWWEAQAQSGLFMAPGAGTFNAAVWTKSVSCRFPESYTDKSKNEHTGADGGAIKHDMSIAVEFVKP